MESLGVMGWGLVLAENSSAVAAAVAVAVPSGWVIWFLGEVPGFSGLHIGSPGDVPWISEK